MAKKNIRSRIVHKHDTAENWAKTFDLEQGKKFVPLKAELIVYDADSTYNYERFKIGDGVTDVTNLPFFEAAYTLTDADVQRIVTAVLAALPNGDEVMY